LEYGFNEVVLRECERQGSVTDEAVARVRGDAYTEVLRQAKTLLTKNGKRTRVNLNIDAFRPWHEIGGNRTLAYPANIDFQWQRWIDEGLMDEAIMRMYRLPMSDIWDDALGQEMTARCEKAGIPMTVNRYINPNYPAEFDRVRNDGRFSGFILYETANFLKFDEQGECSVASEPTAEVCRQSRE
jgi:hypothetical protein